MGKLVIASGNKGKVREFEEYLRGLGLELFPKPDHLEIEETGQTFMENARLKATHTALATHCFALADDSGLEVDALGGAPGVYSSRYGRTDAERISRLLTELGDRPSSARFVCAIAVADPQGQIVAEALGTCEGEIVHTPKGSQGFGYDPIFYVPQYQLTFGEMSPALKGQISHRARALAQLLPQLQNLPWD
ncbi:MAG: RdgB/HAM1 family non-canonical purine NTP pyrophosphatase [Pseudanabaenaceae cyanobacterium SKYGB_i_bin29]|nr:RdgB/HAM1 family non-canonical purine NTP pyrophosphatase [Pseudanabaenaceae cyanobacterium SKYG29]MDW8421734.1 RdgB/HAM1 family non-canonical purine NTP pyrophosphatase [Pseudanabaenaceae cyanobacterium SKYGB_i_bin29]